MVGMNETPLPTEGRSMQPETTARPTTTAGDSRVTEELIRQIVVVLTQEISPEAIVLFGSHATGQARPDSDIDLLVIEAAPFGAGRDRRKEMARLWQSLARFPVAKDILLYSREEVKRWRNARNHIIARALREGRLLYGQL